MPLRFSTWSGRFFSGKPLAQWLSIVLLFLLLCGGAIVFYSLSIRWFSTEFSRAILELTRQEAFRTSKTITDILSDTLSHNAITPQDEDRITRSLAEFIRQNQNVVGVILSDIQGRIVRLEFLPQAVRGPMLQNLKQSGGSLQGSDAEAMLNLLTREQPNLQQDSRPIYQGNQPVGWITFLFDRTITRNALDLALTRMTGRLTLLLGAMTLFVALAALLIHRQQRIAHRLMERRSEVERLAYVGTLAAGLAHEIRNPLNALAMQLELLEEDVGEGAPQLVAPRLKHIRKGLAGVERTVHDFLSYATPGRQQPQMIELATTIGSLCAEVSISVNEPPMRLEFLVAPGLLAWCDPHALRQILSNLIGNALRAQRASSGPGQLRIEASRNGKWVDILVDDAGSGVPPDHRQRIFDCFFTTHSEGTGLGLPIARRLTEMNGGQLTLVPEPSPLGGARFRLRLSARPLSLPFD